MMSDKIDAVDYLNGNVALKESLGIAADVKLEPRSLGMGEHNLNYRFDDPATGRAFVLRVNVLPQPFHENQVAYEFAALSALGPSGRVPEALYIDDSDDAPGEGVLVIGFRTGTELDFDNLRPGDLRCAAQIMADVHAVPVGEGLPLHRPDDPLRDLFDECIERFEAYRSSAFEDARLTRWAEWFISACAAEVEGMRPSSGGLHIVNTETLPSHFLIPAESAAAAAAAGANAGRFCDDPGSFIDWERPIIGEVAQDVAYFVSPTTTFWDSDFLFPTSDVDQFVEDYWRAVDGRFGRDGFDERFRAFRKMTVLRSVTWCCWALIRYGGEGAHRTEKTERKLPVYLSDDFMRYLAEECFSS